MAIAKITGPGLAAIAVSVALLWSCVLGERSLARRAVTERAQVLREMQRLQRRRTVPVSLPSPRTHHHERTTAG
ncbi:MAG TPA: hypothetical protein VKU19_28305 [Bryobacteraceae bacterium]|nr:hypothetical protein [Bryobacteraceae bacterium]